MAKKKSNGVRRILQPYRSYAYRDGKDPAIFEIKTMVQDEGVTEAQLHVLSGVSTSTFANWFRGDTRRPTHACLAAVAGALGHEYVLRKTQVIDYAKELPKAKLWLDRMNEHKKAQKE